MPGNAPVFNADNIPLNTTTLKGIEQRNGLIDALVGQAVGAQAVRSRVRIRHSQDNSGKVVLETFNPISRVTTAADVANLKAELLRRDRTLAFPRDLSGNGGVAYNRT